MIDVGSLGAGGWLLWGCRCFARLLAVQRKMSHVGEVSRNSCASRAGARYY